MSPLDATARNVLLVAPWHETESGAAAMDIPPGVTPEEARVLLVTFRRAADACSRTWRETVADPRELVAVAAGAEEIPDHVEREGEVLVSEESADPTWAGIHVNEWLTRWQDDDVEAPIVVHVEGLEALVEQTDAETAFRFLHLLVSRVRRADATGRYLVDPDACRETTVRTLAHACEAIYEYDEADDTWT